MESESTKGLGWSAVRRAEPMRALVIDDRCSCNWCIWPVGVWSKRAKRAWSAGRTSTGYRPAGGNWHMSGRRIKAG